MACVSHIGFVVPSLRPEISTCRNFVPREVPSASPSQWLSKTPFFGFNLKPRSACEESQFDRGSIAFSYGRTTGSERRVQMDFIQIHLGVAETLAKLATLVSLNRLLISGRSLSRVPNLRSLRRPRLVPAQPFTVGGSVLEFRSFAGHAVWS